MDTYSMTKIIQGDTFYKVRSKIMNIVCSENVNLPQGVLAKSHFRKGRNTLKIWRSQRIEQH